MNHLIGSFQRNYNPNLQTIVSPFFSENQHSKLDPKSNSKQPEVNESILSLSRKSSISNIEEISRRQSMAADMLKSMTEYDYINNKTNSQDKKMIMDLLDVELSGKKESHYNPSHDVSQDVVNHDIQQFQLHQSIEIVRTEFTQEGQFQMKKSVEPSKVTTGTAKVYDNNAQFIENSIEIHQELMIDNFRESLRDQSKKSMNSKTHNLSGKSGNSSSHNSNSSNTIPLNLLTAQQIQQENINERFSKKSNRSSNSKRSNYHSDDIRQSLNRRSNISGSLLEDRDLKEIFAKESTGLMLSRHEPEDDVLLKKDSIENDNLDFPKNIPPKHLKSAHIESDLPNYTEHPQKYRYSDEKDEKSMFKNSTQICTNSPGSPGSDPHFSETFQNARDMIINTTPLTYENGKNYKKHRDPVGSIDGMIRSPETKDSVCTPELDKSTIDDIKRSRQKMISSDFEDVASTLRKVSHNLKLQSQSRKSGSRARKSNSRSRLSSNKSNLSQSRNLSNMISKEQPSYSKTFRNRNLQPQKNVFTNHYKHNNDLHQMVKNTVSKMKKDTQTGRMNFKRKNYYEQLKTQSINTLNMASNGGRILNSNTFGKARNHRKQLSSSRVMDLIKKNFERSISRSRSRRNKSMSQYSNTSRGSNKSTNSKKRKKRKKQSYSGLPTGFSRELFSKSYRELTRDRLLKEKSRSLSKKISTRTRTALSQRINRRTSANKKLFSRRKISHQNNLLGGSRGEKCSFQYTERNNVTDKNLQNYKQPVSGSQTDRQRTRSFWKEEEELAQSNNGNKQFRDLINKMYDEDIAMYEQGGSNLKEIVSSKYHVSALKSSRNGTSVKRKRQKSSSKKSQKMNNRLIKPSGYSSAFNSSSKTRTPLLLLGGGSKRKTNRSQSKRLKSKTKKKSTGSKKKESKASSRNKIPRSLNFQNFGSGVLGEELRGNFDCGIISKTFRPRAGSKPTRKSKSRLKSPSSRLDRSKGKYHVRQGSRTKKDQYNLNGNSGSMFTNSYLIQRVPDKNQITRYLQKGSKY